MTEVESEHWAAQEALLHNHMSSFFETLLRLHLHCDLFLTCVGDEEFSTSHV